MDNEPMSTLRDVILAKQKNAGSKQNKIYTTRCITVGVDSAATCEVLSRRGYIWCREAAQTGSVFQVFNPSVKPLVGLQVLVRTDPNPPYKRVVVGVDWDSISAVSNYGGQPYELVNHAATHEWQTRIPGMDAVSIYPRAIAPLRVYPSGGMNYVVAAGTYFFDGDLRVFEKTADQDISTLVPAPGNYRGLTIYINMADNTLHQLNGSEDVIENPIYYPTMPTAYCFPLAHIAMYEGMTILSESDIVDDLRPFYSFSGVIAATVSALETALQTHLDYG